MISFIRGILLQKDRNSFTNYYFNSKFGIQGENTEDYITTEPIFQEEVIQSVFEVIIFFNYY